tara:strand:- start:2663 stop:2764 length:102 start_codon:yes stop_codon:yes gene_type:complete
MFVGPDWEPESIIRQIEDTLHPENHTEIPNRQK